MPTLRPAAIPRDPPTRDTVTGRCLCGDVRYGVTGTLRDVILCHCAMCRKSHGHVGAYTAASTDALRFVEARGLRWYRSSATARRGFCGQCGATLFWQADGRDTISIAAGTLDAPTGLSTILQIHVADAGDYYDVDVATPIRVD